MSVTDGTSSRLLTGPAALVDRRVTPGGFDRLKQLAALLLRAREVFVLIDDEPDDDSTAAPAGVRAFARLTRKRGTRGTFVADAVSQSWPSDARLLGSLGPVACAGVPLALGDGSIVGCVCAVCPEARDWARDEEDVLRSVAGEVASRLELSRAQRAEASRAAEAVGRMQLLDTILATSADHLFVFDRNARYTYVSPAGAASLGRAPGQCLGKTLGDLGFAPDVTEPIERQLRSVFVTGGSVSGEARIDIPEGPRNFEHVFSPVFGPGGRVDAVVATVRDVTGRKAVELHLKEAKTSAEREAVVKDQFLAALSHELRTPLTPVLATVSALSADASLPEHVRGAVGMIRRNVELQTRLIDDLLDLTRVARGKITLNVEPIDLLTALHEAAEMCQTDADAKGVRVALPPRPTDATAESTAGNGTTSDSTPAPCYVLGDGARVRQVLWNLMKNAVKFTPVDGEVTVAVGHDADGRVSLAVKDTGVGIAPHLIDRIFLPFEQGDPQMARRFGGLGLGLAISKALVDLHHGELTAQSAGAGRGATFTLTLPAATAPRATPVAPPRSREAAMPSQRLRVLLVDDHDDTRHVLRRLLSDHAVRTAGCVSRALEEAALYDFDLLISDIGLPDGSGLDLMRQLRARYGMKGIALSGYGTEDDVRRSLGAGFRAHLTKPITSDALFGAIEDVTRESTSSADPV